MELVKATNLSATAAKYQLLRLRSRVVNQRLFDLLFPNGNMRRCFINQAAFCSRSGIIRLIYPIMAVILPVGNILKAMKYTTEKIGELTRNTRKKMGVTQKELALTSGTGLRFIIEMEKGKPTCQFGKVLTVLHTLGIKIEVIPPAANGKKGI
jgi:HTH-type transcriptional regulator / antitoxin HipB